MKKCCKNVNILADDFIENPIYEALDEKWKRPDVAKYLHGRTSSMSLQAMKRLLRDTDERDLMVSGLIRTVAESLRYEIQNRELKVTYSVWLAARWNKRKASRNRSGECKTAYS